MTRNFIIIQKQRAKIIDAIRLFFKHKGFLEVFTPTFVKLPGMEPYLNPLPYTFQDEKNKSYKGYVITSPEYSLKKLLSRGFPNIYQMATVFRQGESFGPMHNPEFTMLEWYRPHSDYTQIMKDVEQLTCAAALAVHKTLLIPFGNTIINLKQPWQKISVKQAFQKYAHVNLDNARTVSSFRKQLGHKPYPIPKNANWDDLFYTVFLNDIEQNFPKNKPIIVYDYPLPQAALAKRKPCSRITAAHGANKSRNSLQGKLPSFYAERFEAYIGGVEIGNAFSELTDWKEQYTRLKHEQALRRKLGKDAYAIDMDFIAGLKSGIPETGGIAVGVERLQMVLLNIQDINDLMTFPVNTLFKSE